MYFLLDKRKISSFCISMGTVIMLFTFSFFINENSNNTIETMGIPINEKVINKVENEKNKVALTINCSENLKKLDQILDILNNNGVNATFYITSDLIKKFPDEIKDILNSNNEIGLLINNYNKFKKVDNYQMINSIKNEIKEIEKNNNKRIKTIRFIYEEFDEDLINAIERLGLKIVNYNIDLLDKNGFNSKEICIRLSEKISPGSIVLMTNSGKYSVDSLENIIKIIKDRKFYLVNISELINNIKN